MSRIRFAAVAVGGDFGGKGTMVQIEPICAMLALKSRHPVRLCLSREEELTSTYLKDSTTCHLKIGVDRNGKLVAFQGSITFDTGAYSMHIANMAEACTRLHGPYLIPNVDIVASRVYTNNIPAGDMRGPSDVQCFFALESHLDMIARKLGIDPIQFRLQNAVDDGDKLPTGERIVNPGIKETLRRTQAYLKKEKGVKKPNEGWGIACEEHRGALMDSHGSLRLPRFALASVWVKINEDGSVIVFTGVKEVGGGQNTVAAQLVAETLGVAYDDVTVVAADTDHTPWDQGSGGNEATYRAGLNALLAAEDARNQLIELAAQKMGTSPTEIELQGGRVYVRDDYTKSMTLAEAAALSLRMMGSPILGTGTGGGVRKAKFAGELPAEKWHDGLQHATHAAKVRVDPDTGKVKVLKYYACHDVGFAINPQNVEGQIEGGVAFGLGCALTEEVIIQDGTTLNANLTDYRLPVALDVPNIECEIVEIPSTAGPLGAKGLGEGTNVPVAPAIANAVCEAIGRRITRLPLTCERVYQALQEKENNI
jgi:CO/xanthine dehydrogenase Mo-binding subunit